MIEESAQTALFIYRSCKRDKRRSRIEGKDEAAEDENEGERECRKVAGRIAEIALAESKRDFVKAMRENDCKKERFGNN
ncbi:MAG: hypothetical protein K2H45_02655 [Acetatifactor sp.]|nr:hypothetical protein [Acetatifactor sp.]